MDEIQKVLIKQGRKDLAQKYYEKVASGRLFKPKRQPATAEEEQFINDFDIPAKRNEMINNTLKLVNYCIEFSALNDEDAQKLSDAVSILNDLKK